MRSNGLIIATVLIASLFFISPALACNFLGPAGSSITVTVYSSDGKTPLPGASVQVISIENGSKVGSVTEPTNSNGQFTFPSDGSKKGNMTYRVYATYYGDEISVTCEGTQHTVGYPDTFSLGQGEKKNIAITIPGVTVVHGGNGVTATPTTCPTKSPDPTTSPTVPKGNHSAYPPMDHGNKAGTIAGVVLYNDSSDPISRAYVTIVNAADPSIEYSGMYTDGNGFYEFDNVNSTNETAYKIFATDGNGNVAHSEPFKVGSGATVKVNLAIDIKKNGGDSPGSPTATIEPTVKPPEHNATITPTPSISPIENGSGASTTDGHRNSLLDQITVFISSIISSIFPK